MYKWTEIPPQSKLDYKNRLTVLPSRAAATTAAGPAKVKETGVKPAIIRQLSNKSHTSPKRRLQTET